jgi:hypothetical protein
VREDLEEGQSNRFTGSRETESRASLETTA